MEFSIEEAMRKNHQDLGTDLEKLIKNADINKEELYREFNNFLGKMRNHFVTEEQAIFSFYHVESKDNNNLVFELLDQHVKILSMLEDVEKRINEWNNIDFSDLRKNIANHVAVENKILYKNLDETLSESEREFVLRKIGEM